MHGRTPRESFKPVENTIKSDTPFDGMTEARKSYVQHLGHENPVQVKRGLWTLLVGVAWSRAMSSMQCHVANSARNPSGNPTPRRWTAYPPVAKITARKKAWNRWVASRKRFRSGRLDAPPTVVDALVKVARGQGQTGWCSDQFGGAHWQWAGALVMVTPRSREAGTVWTTHSGRLLTSRSQPRSKVTSIDWVPHTQCGQVLLSMSHKVEKTVIVPSPIVAGALTDLARGQGQRGTAGVSRWLQGQRVSAVPVDGAVRRLVHSTRWLRRSTSRASSEARAGNISQARRRTGPQHDGEAGVHTETNGEDISDQTSRDARWSRQIRRHDNCSRKLQEEYNDNNDNDDDDDDDNNNNNNAIYIAPVQSFEGADTVGTK